MKLNIAPTCLYAQHLQLTLPFQGKAVDQEEPREYIPTPTQRPGRDCRLCELVLAITTCILIGKFGVKQYDFGPVKYQTDVFIDLKHKMLKNTNQW